MILDHKDDDDTEKMVNSYEMITNLMLLQGWQLVMSR